MTHIQAPGTALTDVGGEPRAAGPPAARRTRRGWVLGLTSAAYFMVVQADVEVTLHLWQRRDHHQRVQHHHEVRGRGEPENPAAPAPPRCRPPGGPLLAAGVRECCSRCLDSGHWFLLLWLPECADTGLPADWAAGERPVRGPGGVYTGGRGEPEAQ